MPAESARFFFFFFSCSVTCTLWPRGNRRSMRGLDKCCTRPPLRWHIARDSWQTTEPRDRRQIRGPGATISVRYVYVFQRRCTNALVVRSHPTVNHRPKKQTKKQIEESKRATSPRPPQAEEHPDGTAHLLYTPSHSVRVTVESAISRGEGGGELAKDEKQQKGNRLLRQKARNQQKNALGNRARDDDDDDDNE